MVLGIASPGALTGDTIHARQTRPAFAGTRSAGSTCTSRSTTAPASPTPRSWGDQKALSVVAFLRRAVEFFARHGIAVQQLLTDNGGGYRSMVHAIACHTLGGQAPATPACGRRPTGGRALRRHMLGRRLGRSGTGACWSHRSTYYRGAGAADGSDLAGTPDSGVKVPPVRRHNLSNFGIFGSPRAPSLLRRQRLRRDRARSVGVGREAACGEPRMVGHARTSSAEGAGGDRRRAVRSYRRPCRSSRESDARACGTRTSTWTSCCPGSARCWIPKKTPSVWHAIAKARAHDSHQAFDKLCHVREGQPGLSATLR